MTPDEAHDQARAALQAGVQALRQGRPDAAEQHLRGFLIHAPDHVDAQHLLASALGSLGIPVDILHGEERLLFELVRKNLYILTTNIAGLETGGTVSELWRDHREIARSVAREILEIQFAVIENRLDSEALMRAMLVAFEGDPGHQCMGRSAPARLSRALEQAREANILTPMLNKIADKHLQ